MYFTNWWIVCYIYLRRLQYIFYEKGLNISTVMFYWLCIFLLFLSIKNVPFIFYVGGLFHRSLPKGDHGFILLVNLFYLSYPISFKTSVSKCMLDVCLDLKVKILSVNVVDSSYGSYIKPLRQIFFLQMTFELI